jgi:hypothetical protein
MWAEQKWESVSERIMGGLLREIGVNAFEVFRFLIHRAINGGPGTGLLEEEGWTLHVLYDAQAIGDALSLPDEDVRGAVDVLADRGWVEVLGNNGNSILILGSVRFHYMDEWPVMEGIDLIFDEKVPRQTWTLEESLRQFNQGRLEDDSR